ncbi:MAG: hypothetical protein HUU21_11805 [Polyangiaceae bacterium]|nr:hypothetical protein [Polyangiaceae bacterium]
MRAACLLSILLSQAVTGCNLVTIISSPPDTPADAAGYPEIEDQPVNPYYDSVIDNVARMPLDDELQESARRRGLHVVNVAWEDTGRAQGSALGPNISDLTLQVRSRYKSGRFDDTPMPVLRFPNFTDKTADVRADRFFVRTGNERGQALRTVPLTELLRDLRRFASSPHTLGGAPNSPVNLLAERDTHFLVSAQAVFLPIPPSGKAEFNPVLFNYQSAPASPAVLAILATREGTSISVIENRPAEMTSYGPGQELYFNDDGQRTAFTAERRSDVAARIQAQGGPRTAADRSALGKGADVLALIQIPLVHKQRGYLGGLVSPDEGYGYEFSDDPLAAGGFGPNDATIRVRPGPVGRGGGDVERAVLGHGPRLGPYSEGYGVRLVRDTRFPIRITVQFYKATSNGIATEEDLDAVARNIASVYEHADFIGSLVVPEGDPTRPTEWQTIPREWFPW